jgi:putative inorganic carbon (hco3(-)) transporter
MSTRQAVRPSRGGTVTNLLQGLLVMAAGLLVGAGLAAVGAKFGDFGPLVLLSLVGIPLLVLGTLLDPRWGVLAVFATFPIGSLGVPAGGFDLEISQVAVLGIAAVVVMGRLASGRTPLPWPVHMWWLLALIAWTLIGLPSAVDQDLAVKQIAALVLGALFTCVVVSTCRTLRDVHVILIGFIAIAVVIGLSAFAQGSNFESTFGGARVQGRAVGSFDHSNQLGSLSAMTSLIAIALVAGARTGRARWAGVLAILVLLGGQALTLSRGAWIGTMVGIAFLAFVLPHARRALVMISIPLFSIGVAIAILAPDNTQVQVIQQRFESLTVRSPYDDRSAIWAEAQREVLDDPVTGQGAGGFPAASTRSASGASTVFAYHAHNILLTWAAEAGLPAVALLVGFAFFLGVSASRARRRADGDSEGDIEYGALVAGLMAALLALLAQGVVDYTLRNAVIFFAVMTVIGCLLASIRLGPSDDGDSDERDERPLFATVP